MTSTTPGRWLARAAGVVAVGCALYILLSDAIRTGHWDTDHLLMPALLGITIAAGHLAGSAMRARSWLSAMGFVMLFTLGTAASVYNSVGRQAAGADTAVAIVAHHNAAKADLERDLAAAREDVSKLAWLIDYEIAGRPKTKGSPDMQGTPTAKTGCGTLCKGYGVRKQEAEAKVERLQGQLGLLGPRQVEAPKADRAAAVAALFGLDRERVKRVLYLLEPFFLALFFELAAIVAFGFGFARPRATVAANDNRSTTVSEPLPARKLIGKPLPAAPAPVHPVIEALAAGPVSSNDELAERMGVSKSEATKRRAEVADLLDVRQDGRRKRIALAR